jgi:hypothetical protein
MLTCSDALADRETVCSIVSREVVRFLQQPIPSNCVPLRSS